MTDGIDLIGQNVTYISGYTLILIKDTKMATQTCTFKKTSVTI